MPPPRLPRSPTSRTARVLEHMPAWARRGGNAAAAGRVLVVSTGLVGLVGDLLLGPPAQLPAVLMTTVVQLALVAASLAVPWQHRPGSTVVFPAVVLLGLGTYGLLSQRVTGAYIGLIPLCFVYLGLFHRGRTALVMIPLAWAAYLAMVPMLDFSTLVRLAVYGLGWWAITHVLAVTTALHREARVQLRAAARTDALTTLANRHDLDERMQQLVLGDCVVLVDLDRFKDLNDRRGHLAGDEILRQFGRTLTQHLRGRDYAARYGGEEFVLVLPRKSAEQAMGMLRSLRREWAAHHPEVTFSAGVHVVEQGADAGAALAAADAALYEAKRSGRNRARVAG